MLKVVLDTNIILSSISSKSPYSIILDALFEGLFELCVSTEILLEYEEKLKDNFNEKVSKNFIESLLILQNVNKTTIYFDLNIIKTDLDDNKFVNCAFASNANYLVSNDKHFNILNEINFPKIQLLKIEQFLTLLKESNNY